MLYRAQPHSAYDIPLPVSSLTQLSASTLFAMSSPTCLQPGYNFPMPCHIHYPSLHKKRRFQALTLQVEFDLIPISHTTLLVMSSLIFFLHIVTSYQTFLAPCRARHSSNFHIRHVQLYDLSFACVTFQNAMLQLMGTDDNTSSLVFPMRHARP